MGAGNSRKGTDGSLGPMCKGILLTFFYLMLVMQSKVIDQSADHGPVLGGCWGQAAVYGAAKTEKKQFL